MQIVEITGYSDDCVEFEGDCTEEYYINQRSSTWRGRLVSEDKDLFVKLTFCIKVDDGWGIELESKIPEGWNVEFAYREGNNSQDEKIIVTIPSDAPIFAEELAL